MSPLHRHFELEGWSEDRIVKKFAFYSFLFSMLAVSLFLAFYLGYI